MSNLNIFISSTCFDLAQIRADLSESLISWGNKPILSEKREFPINPSLDTIDNCIEIVQKEADILILIVGTRYGYVTRNGKSITNSEFITARKKGIPIFIFIHKKILNILPLWEKNPDADYSDYVDTTELFDFVKDIRFNKKLWSFEFENANDIISTLKIQLSYLFKEALTTYSKLNNNLEDLNNLNISGRSLNILINKIGSFEYQFLAQTLIDEINKNEHSYNDYQFRILTNFTTHFMDEPIEITHWMLKQMRVLEATIDSINNLFKGPIKKFIAAPGVPSDIKGLFYCATTYARLYARILNWSIEVYSVRVPIQYIKVRDQLGYWANNIIEELRAYPFNLKKQLDYGDAMVNENPAQPQKIDCILSLTVDPAHQEALTQELENIAKQIKSQTIQ